VFVCKLGLKLISSHFKISERRITGITRSVLQVAMQAVRRQRWQHRPSREAPRVIAPTPRQGGRLLISSNSSNKPHNSNNSRRNLRSWDKKTCVIALGFAGTVNTDDVDPLLPVHRLCYQRKPDLRRAVISRRDCRCNYKFRLWQYIEYGWRTARLWNVIINLVL